MTPEEQEEQAARITRADELRLLIGRLKAAIAEVEGMNTLLISKNEGYFSGYQMLSFAESQKGLLRDNQRESLFKNTKDSLLIMLGCNLDACEKEYDEL